MKFMPDKAEVDAYEAGRNAIICGPTNKNCNIRHFSTQDRMAAWQRGHDLAQKELTHKLPTEESDET